MSEGVGGGRRAYDEDFEGFVLVEGDLRLQYGCVGALSDALTDGEAGVVEPRPAVHGERRGGGEGGHDGRVAAL